MGYQKYLLDVDLLLRLTAINAEATLTTSRMSVKIWHTAALATSHGPRPTAR